MSVHLAVMMLFVIGEIYLLRISLGAITQYSNLVNQLNDDDVSTAPYVVYEQYIAKQFNIFFFGASSECSSKLLMSINILLQEVIERFY